MLIEYSLGILEQRCSFKKQHCIYLEPHWQTIQKRDYIFVQKRKPRFSTVI